MCHLVIECRLCSYGFCPYMIRVVYYITHALCLAFRLLLLTRSHVLFLYWCILYCYSYLFTCQLSKIWRCYIWCLGIDAPIEPKGEVITKVSSDGWHYKWSTDDVVWGRCGWHRKAIHYPRTYLFRSYRCVILAINLLLVLNFKFQTFCNSIWTYALLLLLLHCYYMSCSLHHLRRLYELMFPWFDDGD